MNGADFAQIGNPAGAQHSGSRREEEEQGSVDEKCLRKQAL